jgi:uncharacterized protein YodC (DUF2158 family)
MLASKRRIPKFIKSDKLQTKNGSLRNMCIQKFVRVTTPDNREEYNGFLLCYWFDNGCIKKETFHEDELERWEC